MSISMIGIDHNMAPVDIRAKFAFTKKNAGEAMEKIKNQNGIYGCVILSTCNRLEVWASVDDEVDVCLYDCLCRIKGITEDSYRQYFVERKDQEAVEHLSPIFLLPSDEFCSLQILHCHRQICPNFLRKMA